MSAATFVAGVISAAIGGALLGAIVSLRISSSVWRTRIRLRCDRAASWIVEWFGNPYTISAMGKRISLGHTFLEDRPWRRQLKAKLEEIFLARRSG